MGNVVLTTVEDRILQTDVKDVVLTIALPTTTNVTGNNSNNDEDHDGKCMLWFTHSWYLSIAKNKME